jgi:hypothetical protein
MDAAAARQRDRALFERFDAVAARRRRLRGAAAGEVVAWEDALRINALAIDAPRPPRETPSSPQAGRR